MPDQQPQTKTTVGGPDVQGDQAKAALWAISTGSFAGGVIGLVLADEISNGRITLSILLIIAILLLTGFTGWRRMVRLIVSAFAAAFVVILVLLARARLS